MSIPPMPPMPPPGDGCRVLERQARGLGRLQDDHFDQAAVFIGVLHDLAQRLLDGRLISWNFNAQALICTCSGVFQGLRNALPALASSASRLLTCMLPAIWL